MDELPSHIELSQVNLIAGKKNEEIVKIVMTNNFMVHYEKVN